MNIDYILQNHGIGGYRKRDETPPPTVSNFKAEAGNSKVTLTWENPIDTDFVGVKILRKVGDYPASTTDGVVVYAGANTSYVDTTVTNGITYYYRVFAYDWDNNYNDTDIGQQATATPRDAVIYGVKIDTTNSNPETAVTYINMATGFTPANGNNGNFLYGSWQDKFPFNEIKPCLLKDGVVNYYLNPNDYTQKADGTPAETITGADGDVMVEFPKIYWKMEKVDGVIYVRYSNAQIDSSYKCLAHMRGDVEKDRCYVGAYLASEVASKLRSLKRAPSMGKTLSLYRTLAQANGPGYDPIAYYQIVMLQILFVVMFKSLNSQVALGKGHTGYSTVDGIMNLIGNTDKKGMFWGSTSGVEQVKFCGIEDFWGNGYYFLDGLRTDANRCANIGTENFNDEGIGYKNVGYPISADLGGWLSDVQGTTETGFFPIKTLGSATTYYTDYSSVYMNRVPRFGGDYFFKESAGAFLLHVNMATSTSSSGTGGRLMKL